MPSIAKTHDSILEYYQLIGGHSDEFLPETAGRVWRFSEELKSKREYDRLTVFDSDADEMIIGNHLRMFSICEHHLLPFFGEVSIGYIPDGQIFGLSKFQRIVDKFASKPQIQERLTKDIADFIVECVHPKGVGVVVVATHTCVFARGVQSASAEFTTNVMYGAFKENAQARNEFLSCVHANNHK